MQMKEIAAVMGIEKTAKIEEKTEMEEDIVRQKKKIRKEALMRRDSLPAAKRAEYDAIIQEQVCGLSEYREAQLILAYIAYRSETGTTELIKRALSEGKAVFAPKVSGDGMEFWQIGALSDLREGYRGIQEPLERVSLPEWLFQNVQNISDSVLTGIDGRHKTGKAVYRAMMWMPGVAFDRERHRIGYGKGFYDRYLVRLADLQKELAEHGAKLCMTTVALAYGCQVVERIPSAIHDIRPDKMITSTPGLI